MKQAFKQFLIVVLLASMAACHEKEDEKAGSSPPPSAPPPPPQAPPPEPGPPPPVNPSPQQRSEVETPGNVENPEADKRIAETPTPPESQPPGILVTPEKRTTEIPSSPEQRRVEVPASPVTPAPEVPTEPDKRTADVPAPKEAPKEVQSVAELEAILPSAEPTDTLGGQLIVDYLEGRLSEDQVVRLTIGDGQYFKSKLAEMSLAVHYLRQENRFTEKDDMSKRALETAMDKFLAERIKYDEDFERKLEYGTAISVGVVGGIYSNQIWNVLKRLGDYRIVSVPVNGVVYVYNFAKDGIYAMGRGVSDLTKSAVNSAPVTKASGKSREYFVRAAGYLGTQRGKLTGQEVASQNITRALGAPRLAEGYSVQPLLAEELEAAQRLQFQKTGIVGFRIHQRESDEYLIARVLNSQGQYEYFRVTGRGVSAATNDGHEVIVPAATMTRLIVSRLKNWGTNTLTFVSETGQRTRTGVANMRAYQFASTNPTLHRIVQGTAIGAPISVVTLLALRPIDFTHLTIDDYVQELHGEGIHIEDFINMQRDEAQAAAKVPKHGL